MELDWTVNLDRRTAESPAGFLVFHPAPDGNFWVAATSAATADLASLIASASAAIAVALKGRRDRLERLGLAP